MVNEADRQRFDVFLHQVHCYTIPLYHTVYYCSIFQFLIFYTLTTPPPLYFSAHAEGAPLGTPLSLSS